MKSYRINYIDGHDLRYKSFETNAETREDAISALWDKYWADFDHQIIEVIALDKAVSPHMRIGKISESWQDN